MSFCPIETSNLAPLLDQQRSTGPEPEDDGMSAEEMEKPSSTDESRRIVEEAIRRLEEAEHEWSRSWEPDKPTD